MTIATSPVVGKRAAATEERLTGAQWLLFIGLLVGVFLGAMDSTVLATLLPRMLGDLGAMAFAPWIVAVYLLMQICAGPIFGKLSDQIGRKRVFLFSLAVFAGGSELIGWSRGALTLLVGRAVQGIGAGIAVPVALSSIYLLFPRSLQPRLNGWFSATYGLACIVGPIVGQLAGAAFGWQAVFHANAPIVAIAAIIIVTQMDDVIQPSAERFDWRGALSFASATMFFVF